ncbi:MAG: metallophosphoesterase [Bacteroidaceae bacterium]|nr:metallophosphoesterase [Bacteroidaceae bacterium]MBP5323211.1 metallophosphoesterase [Bacteroidaceae bacterium]
MDRRQFLKNSAMIAAAAAANESAAWSQAVGGTQGRDEHVVAPSQPLITSAPMLQNYAETSMGVAFAVSGLANGFVSYGLKPDLGDAVTVKCGGYRVTDINPHVMLVRLTGLLPATTYYYRIGADAIDYKGGYNMRVTDTVVDPRIYSFTTAGAKAHSSFCIINDTHAQWKPFGMAVDKIAQLAPACVVWNGDATNCEEQMDSLVNIFLRPDIERNDYAALVPYLFCNGNHDCRGMASRHLERVWMYRQPEERAARDWDLGRNFAVRTGDIALIGLDTGEDKLDDDPRFAGLFSSGPYREAQVAWLRDALQRPYISSAPFLVAICHIPLFDLDPKANPGDILPKDAGDDYDTDYASWQRTCARLWSPLLEQAGCQLVITAHQHKYRYDAPTATRPWVQIVGGGPEMNLEAGLYPTVIEGSVNQSLLRIRVHNLLTDTVQEQFTFAPRRKN